MNGINSNTDTGINSTGSEEQAGASNNNELIRARDEDTNLIGTKLIWNEQANNGAGDYQTVDEMNLNELFIWFDFDDTSKGAREVTIESLNYFSAMLERRIPEPVKQGTQLEMTDYFRDMKVTVTDQLLEKFYKYKQTHFDNLATGNAPTQSHLNIELADKVYCALRALK